nr:AAA family ATPase [Thalassospira sp. ER-Se-21-Dark]
MFLSGTVRVKKISIKNLKNVSSLEFELPGKGVWLLAGENGAGKTTLLGCLRRIGSSTAFPVHFPSSKESDRLDNYSDSSITYSVGKQSVTYGYSGSRWSPRPRKNSEILRKFGFPNVIYVGATAERITPRPEDFEPKKLISVRKDLIGYVNYILNTDKFEQLRKVNLSQGGRKTAYVLKVGNNYHSEKQFSLGELCVLSLVEKILECKSNSLVLIDELEMALHPSAQSHLFEFIKEIAEKKNLTVIFSTHSVTLLKRAHRKKIIFLQREDHGKVSVVSECFPTYALGSLTVGEEASPDFAIYVEDEVARAIVRQLGSLVVSEKYPNLERAPSVKVCPIGGFSEVINFLSNSDSLLSPSTSTYALLDKDVEEEALENWKNNENYQKLEKYKKLADRIGFLPWTPEVGIVEFVSSKANERILIKAIRERYQDHHIQLSVSNPDRTGKTPAQVRELCKAELSGYVEYLSRAVGKRKDTVMDDLCSLFAMEYFKLNRASVMSLIGPIVS